MLAYYGNIPKREADQMWLLDAVQISIELQRLAWLDQYYRLIAGQMSVAKEDSAKRVLGDIRALTIPAWKVKRKDREDEQDVRWLKAHGKKLHYG